MSKGDTFENEMLECIFNNADIPLIGDATGIRQSVANGDIWVSLHTGDPGEAGDQTTSEIGYTSYARVAVDRDGAAWTVTANSVSPASAITFPAGTGGSGTATHFAVGAASTGSGKLLYSGTVTPNIVCGDGVTPELTTATAITED
ncbi:MAG: phage tail fiber protein [Candidatus Thorarchaeota archaeon]|jgi:hypothetical protein